MLGILTIWLINFSSSFFPSFVPSKALTNRNTHYLVSWTANGLKIFPMLLILYCCSSDISWVGVGPRRRDHLLEETEWMILIVNVILMMVVHWWLLFLSSNCIVKHVAVQYNLTSPRVPTPWLLMESSIVVSLDCMLYDFTISCTLSFAVWWYKLPGSYPFSQFVELSLSFSLSLWYLIL